MKQPHMKQHLMMSLMLASVAGVAHAEPLTVDFWYTFGDAKRSAFIQSRAEEYNKTHSDVKVVPTYKGSYNDTLQAAILASRQGKAPALVQVVEVGSQLAWDSGIFQPVGGIGKVDFSDYIKPVLNYYTIQGKVNSLPFNSSSPVLYYNKDLMEKMGLDPSRPPTTYGAVLKACEKIKMQSSDIKCIGFNIHSWFVEQWMAQQGAALVNNDNGRKARATESNLTSPAAKKIFNWIKTLSDKGYYTSSGKLEDWDGSDAIFTNEKVVFHITSTADIGNIGDAARKAGFKMGVGVLPIADGAKRNGVVIGGASLWVARGISEKQADAALDFALYLTNPRNMAAWHKLTGYYPVRNSSVDLLRKEGWFTQAPVQTVAFNQLLKTQSNVATGGALLGSFIEVRKIIEEGVQKVLSGNSVDATLQEAKTRADKAIQDYNKNFQ